MTKDTDRHSEPIHSPAHEPLTPEQRAPIEAENGFRQFDRLIKILERYLDGLRKENKEDFPVRPSMLMELNRIAVDKLISNPGGYRQTPMTIKSSAGVVKHEPPSWEDVPGWVDEMCDYVNQNWNKPALHLSAYLLWRVNWIHPFSDGNGRTARAISYLVLCVRLRQRLPGDRTMPEFISDEKSPYYAGLEVADEAYKKGTIDVSKLEAYLHELLMRQGHACGKHRRHGRHATDSSAETRRRRNRRGTRSTDSRHRQQCRRITVDAMDRVCRCGHRCDHRWWGGSIALRQRRSLYRWATTTVQVSGRALWHTDL